MFLQGERLSHAVGCAFAICLERKQKREKESVTVTFNDKGTSFTRTGSFRQTTLTERLADPQSAIVAGSYCHHNSYQSVLNYWKIILFKTIAQLEIWFGQLVVLAHFYVCHLVELCRHSFMLTVLFICLCLLNTINSTQYNLVLLNRNDKWLKYWLRKAEIQRFVFILCLKASLVLHFLCRPGDCSTWLLQTFQNICYHISNHLAILLDLMQQQVTLNTEGQSREWFCMHRTGSCHVTCIWLEAVEFCTLQMFHQFIWETT